MQRRPQVVNALEPEPGREVFKFELQLPACLDGTVVVRFARLPFD